MQHKFFPNRFKLWEYLQPQCEGLDFNRTLRLPICSYSINDEDFIFHNSKDFLVSLNKRFGLNYDEVRSQRRGQKFTLIWWEDDKDQAVKKSEETSEVVIEESIIDTELETASESPDVDWEWIESLTNTKPSKKALDEYAEKEFGLSLNRRNTLENMIIDFKEQLGLKD